MPRPEKARITARTRRTGTPFYAPSSSTRISKANDGQPVATAVVLRVRKTALDWPRRRGIPVHELDQHEMKVQIPSSVCLTAIAPGKWEVCVSRYAYFVNNVFIVFEGWLQAPPPAKNKIPVLVKMATIPWRVRRSQQRSEDANPNVKIQMEARILTGPLLDLQGTVVPRFYGLYKITTHRKQDITVSVQQWVGKADKHGSDVTDLSFLSLEQQEAALLLIQEFHSRKVIHDFLTPLNVVLCAPADKLIKNSTALPEGMEQGEPGTLAIIHFDRGDLDATADQIQYEDELINWCLKKGDPPRHLKPEHCPEYDWGAL